MKSSIALTTADGKTGGIPIYLADKLYRRDTKRLAEVSASVGASAYLGRDDVSPGRKTFIKTVRGVDDPRKRGKARRRGDKTRRTALFAKAAFNKRRVADSGPVNSGLDLATKEALASAVAFERFCAEDPNTAVNRWMNGE